MSIIKNKFKSSQVSIGTWMSLGNTGIAEIFVNAGFDWVAIDLEHSAISIRQAEELIRIVSMGNASPIVRLTGNDPNQIKRIMDAGAHGIIVPMVNTAKEASDAIAACHYPPLGTRGVGLSRAQNYGNGFKEYYKWQKTEPLIVIQIEDIRAVPNLEDIFNVKGVDAYMIGPYDLSCSMGIPGEFDNPEFKKVLNRIKKTAKKVGLPAGIHLVEPDVSSLKKLIKEGYLFIAYSVDFRMIDVCSREATNLLRDSK